MTQAQTLARALNTLAKSSQFSYTKALNEGFNPEVEGCETFALRDGSTCEWVSGTFTYVARPAR
ncbi:MAG TPA: hypothetical protein VGU66_04140 [Candidatus Elarobacter sp.]|nr:hypothetical protein [Candidatus Elarobacter sp.]